MKRILAITIVVALVVSVGIIAQPSPKPQAKPQPQAQPQAQEKDQVITAPEAPGLTIRIVHKEKGKIVDDGRYVKAEVLDRALAANKAMGDYIQRMSMAGLSIVEPQLYSVITDSSYVYIKKSMLRPAPGTPEPPKGEEPK